MATKIRMTSSPAVMSTTQTAARCETERAFRYTSVITTVPTKPPMMMRRRRVKLTPVPGKRGSSTKGVSASATIH
jgi:hypothetical protein